MSDCEGSSRHPVTPTVPEYGSLRRQGTTAFVEPPTFTDLVQNPRRVVELSNRELVEIGGQDPRQLLLRSLQRVYREVRREYAVNLRAAQVRHETPSLTACESHRRLIDGLLAAGKRLEEALSVVRHAQSRDVETSSIADASIAPEL